MHAVRTFLFRALATLGFVYAGLCSADWLPKERLSRLAIADPFETRMMLMIHEAGLLNASLGATIPLLGLSSAASKNGFNGPLPPNRAGNPTPATQSGPQQFAAPAAAAPFEVQLGLEARGYFTLVQEGSRFPLKTVDGTVGGYLDMRFRSWQLLTRFSHVSGHLADGADMSTAVPFSRETASVRLGYAPDTNLHLYAGFGSVVHAEPYVDSKIVQLGGSYFWPDTLMVVPFIALDMQLRTEWNTTSSDFQLGLAFGRSENHQRSIRVYYNFYSGGDIRGQYFGQLSTSHAIGVEVPL